MKKNMGTVDRIVRLVFAAVVAILYLTGSISGVVGIVLLVLAGIFLITGLVRFCPLYALFGLSTCNTEKRHSS